MRKNKWNIKDNARAFLNQYIGYYENKLTTVKGSGRKK